MRGNETDNQQETVQTFIRVAGALSQPLGD